MLLQYWILDCFSSSSGCRLVQTQLACRPCGGSMHCCSHASDRWRHRPFALAKLPVAEFTAETYSSLCFRWALPYRRLWSTSILYKTAVWCSLEYQHVGWRCINMHLHSFVGLLTMTLLRGWMANGERQQFYLDLIFLIYWQCSIFYYT